MDVTPLIEDNINVIRDVSLNGITVGDDVYARTIIISPHNVRDVDNRSVQDLTPDNLQAVVDLLEGDIDLLIIGTGSRHAFIPPNVRQVLADQNIGVDFMDTRAACRTYNVLVSEGRRLAVLLFPLSDN